MTHVRGGPTSTPEQLGALYDALLTTEPTELLTPLVTSSGGRLVRAAREDVVYRPGRDAQLRFAADVDRSGVIGLEGWVICAGGDASIGTHVLDSPYGQVAAWRVRDDPLLPGLKAALDRASVGGLLQDLGVASEGLALSLLAYRPQRRAVVLARTPTHELYLKCVPADKAPPLHRRHVACTAAGVPVPRAIGYDPGLGLLVLTPLSGTSVRSALLRDEPALPAPAELVALMDAFGAVELDEPARSPVRQARGHAQLLRTLLPAEAGRVDDLLGAVRAVPDGQTRVVHGDFYDDQVLVRDGGVAGVVDVDGAGLGHPADDAGNLLAHLLLLRELLPATSVLRGWMPGMVAALRAAHEPEQLGRRTAAVLIGLATWPHSQQLPDWQAQTAGILDLAQQALQTPG